MFWTIITIYFGIFRGTDSTQTVAMHATFPLYGVLLSTHSKLLQNKKSSKNVSTATFSAFWCHIQCIYLYAHIKK